MLIIVPAYNEEESIKSTVDKIIETSNFDYVVINDGSLDTTKQVLENNNFNHLDLPINLGIGGAMQTGYLYALNNNYDYAVQLDADGQHNPNDLESLYDEIEKTEYDMVIGSRFVEKSAYKGSLSRRIGIYYFFYFIKALTGIEVTDPTSGYRIVNRKVIKEFCDFYPSDYPEVEVLVNLANKNYLIKEIKVEMNQRMGGKSSITPKRSIYYMLKVSYISLIRSLF